VTWIEDKMRVLEQTDELKMDLTGIMTLQRKLSGMERDLAAIQVGFTLSEAKLCEIPFRGNKFGAHFHDKSFVNWDFPQIFLFSFRKVP
jgi:hypothetical protein